MMCDQRILWVRLLVLLVFVVPQFQRVGCQLELSSRGYTPAVKESKEARAHCLAVWLRENGGKKQSTAALTDSVYIELYKKVKPIKNMKKYT